MAVEVLDENEVAGDAGHFAEEGGALFRGEVVEEEGGMNDVAGVVGEWEMEGVGLEALAGGGGEVAVLEVEAEGLGLGEAAGDGAGEVAGGGADIEKAEGLASKGLAFEEGKQVVASAGEVVDAGNIGEVEGSHLSGG